MNKLVSIWLENYVALLFHTCIISSQQTEFWINICFFIVLPIVTIITYISKGRWHKSRNTTSAIHYFCLANITILLNQYINNNNSGRSLVTMVKSAVGYVKKETAHDTSFLDSNKQLPSGNYINILLDYVLDDMWEENLATLKSKKKSKLQEVDGNSEIQRKERQKIGHSLGLFLLDVCLSPFHSTQQLFRSFLFSRWKEAHWTNRTVPITRLELFLNCI